MLCHRVSDTRRFGRTGSLHLQGFTWTSEPLTMKAQHAFRNGQCNLPGNTASRPTGSTSSIRQLRKPHISQNLSLYTDKTEMRIIPQARDFSSRMWRQQKGQVTMTALLTAKFERRVSANQKIPFGEVETSSVIGLTTTRCLTAQKSEVIKFETHTAFKS